MSLQLLVLGSLVPIAATCLILVVVTASAKARRTRREALLRRLSAPYRPLLLEIASDEDEGGQAWSTLAELSGREWVSLRPSVIGMLAKLRGRPVSRLVELLEAHGDVARAREKLGARSPVRRARAANLLGLARDEQSVPGLIGLLHDPAPDVRLVAARALGRVGDPAAADAVLDSVPGPRGRVGVPSWVAAEALLAMRPGPVLEQAVCRALLSAEALVRDVGVTVSAYSNLGEPLTVIRECLHFETDLDIKEGMIEALGRLGGEEDVALIAGYTGRYAPPKLRRTCVRALGQIGGPEAFDRLGALLGDTDRASAVLAAEALAAAGPAGVRVLDAAVAQSAGVTRVVAAALHKARLTAAVGV